MVSADGRSGREKSALVDEEEEDLDDDKTSTERVVVNEGNVCAPLLQTCVPFCCGYPIDCLAHHIVSVDLHGRVLACVGGPYW